MEIYIITIQNVDGKPQRGAFDARDWPSIDYLVSIFQRVGVTVYRAEIVRDGIVRSVRIIKPIGNAY